jgi:hypothetical protein
MPPDESQAAAANLHTVAPAPEAPCPNVSVCHGCNVGHGTPRTVQGVMEAVEGGRRWGACQEAVQPADELKAACDAADGWLKVTSLPEL